MAEFATCVKYKRPDKLVVENNADIDEMQRIDVAKMAGRCSITSSVG